MRSRSRPLRPNLIDSITEAIASAADHPARIRVIAGLIREICESVVRRYPDPDSGELVSRSDVATETAPH